MADMTNTVRKTFSPGFVLTLGILVAALVGLRGLTGAWEWALTKKPLPMRRAFSEMPKRVGPLEQVASHKMTATMERRLSTDNYISATYRDHSVPLETPGSGYSLHAVYYTGNEEPVSAAHVPEVCYVGGGYERKGLRVTEIALDIPDAAALEGDKVVASTVDGMAVTLPGLEVPVRQFEFLTPETQKPGSVIYFFIYNGKYEASRNKIGLQFLDRSSRYVYYAKIEVMPGRLVKAEDRDEPVFVGGIDDAERSRELAAAFLSRMLPELVACCPDWEAVQAGEIPATAARQRRTRQAKTVDDTGCIPFRVARHCTRREQQWQ